MAIEPRTTEGCPDEDVIGQYAQGRLAADARPAIESHLDACPPCAEVVAGLVRIFGTSSPKSVIGSDEDVEATFADAGVPVDDAPLPAGTTIGRYRLLECIGAGGMGVVYAAYDPELDRRIAIKLLRSRASPQTDERKQRLLREAQVLARLSHPNVVAVHDVGTFADQVFVAMEFVDGVDLGRWLRARPRSWPEIRAVFVAAGRGLAAAHAMGLVHRDFKPENVLVGSDARVRVTDFGLARAAGQNGGVSIDPSLQDSTGQIPLLTLTTTGAMLGTPAYMAPEQFAGRRIDATSDQYAFCVALYEAVVGERPFAAKSVAQLATAVLEQDPVVPPTARAPIAVRRAILRGLSRERSQRFATMDDLLAVLERDRSRVRRVAAAGIGVAAVSVAIGVGVGARTSETTPQRCLDEPLAVWDDAALSALGDRFAAGDVAFASTAWASVRTGLDERIGSLRTVHAAACAAWGDAAGDRELALRKFECIDDRERELAAVLEVLREADSEMMREAVRIPETLEDAATCEDVDALTRERVPAPDPRLVSRVAEVRARLEHAVALEFAGRYEDALAETGTALAEADEIGYVPLRAEVLVRRGILLDRSSRISDAIETFYAATAAATASRHHRVAARAWIELVYTLGRHERRFREGWIAAGQAAAELDALGGDEALEASRLTNVGTLAFTEGRVEESLEPYRQALALRERLGQPLKQADVLFNIANVEIVQLRFVEAERHLNECLERWRSVVGIAHPDTVDIIHSLGTLYGHMADHHRAIEQFELAYRLRTELLGPDSRETAISSSALGRELVAVGRTDEGVPLIERAVASLARIHGPTHIVVADQRSHLAQALWNANRPAEARRELESALEIEDTVLGPEHHNSAMSRRLLAYFDSEEGDYARAEKRLRQAIATFEKTDGPDGEATVETRRMLEDLRARRPLSIDPE